MPQIVWTVRHEGQVDYFNQRWYEFTGRPPGELEWHSILHPQDLIKCLELWDKAEKDGLPYEIEYRFWDYRNSNYRWFLGRAVPMRDADGKLIRWFGTCTDIDGQKRALEALNISQERLRASLRGRDEFIGVAGHELRTPITTLRLQFDLMSKLIKSQGLESISSERWAKMHEISSKQVLRLSGLIDELLDVATIASGKLSLHRSRLDLSALVSETMEGFGEQLNAAGYRLVSDLQEGLSGEWDRPKIEQVISNLISNAMKYGQRKPIEVSTQRCPAGVRLTVRDHGIGIAPENIDRIFDRFERVNPTAGITGLGLGLFITREIVEAHGGRIEVKSAPNQGSTFVVTLPISDGASSISNSKP